MLTVYFNNFQKIPNLPLNADLQDHETETMSQGQKQIVHKCKLIVSI